MNQSPFWKDPLLAAQSIVEVQRVVDDYLKTLYSKEIEALPPACWDALTATDISGSALLLTREGLLYSGMPVNARILHDVTQLYVAASDRIVALQGRAEAVFRNSIETEPSRL